MGQQNWEEMWNSLIGVAVPRDVDPRKIATKAPAAIASRSQPAEILEGMPVKSVLLFVATALVALINIPAQESAQTWAGQVTDTVCSKHPAPGPTGPRGVASRKQCTLTCVKNHADFALLINDKLYEISNAKDVLPSLQKYAGEDVKITGVMNGATIAVSKIAIP